MSLTPTSYPGTPLAPPGPSPSPRPALPWLSRFINSIPSGFSAHILGLGFGGTAVYGFISGRIAQTAVTTCVSLASFYLGMQRKT